MPEKQFDLWPEDADIADEAKKAKKAAEADDWAPDDLDGHFPRKQRTSLPDNQEDFFPEEAKNAKWRRKILEEIKDEKEKKAVIAWWATADKMRKRLKKQKN